MIVNSVNHLSTARAVKFGANAPKVPANVAENVVQQAVTKSHTMNPLMKKVGLPLALAAAVLGGAALMTGCEGGTSPSSTIVNPVDPTDPTDPTGVTLSETQKSIMSSVLSSALASNAIIEQTVATSDSMKAVVKSTADTAVLTDSGIAKNISYTDQSGYVFNLALDQTKLGTDQNVLVYSGTKYNPDYDESTSITRTYYSTSDSEVVEYLDSDASHPNKDTNKGTYIQWDRVIDGKDVPVAQKIPTSTPGKLDVMTADGGALIGSITDYTLTIEK